MKVIQICVRLQLGCYVILKLGEEQASTVCRCTCT